MKIKMPAQAAKVIQTLEQHGFEAYIVGGCVRDSILGRTPGDWDITTSASPQEVKEIFDHTVDTGIEHGTVTVLMNHEPYEVTTYRVDGKYEDHRRPNEVHFTKSLKEDLLRRDFTINAMAYNRERGLVDAFGGQKDLEHGVIRCVGAARERFTEDALRILRAIRFSAQLGFAVEETTYEAIKDIAPNLVHVSRERVQVELTKLLTSPLPGCMRLVYETGISPWVSKAFHRIPEVSGDVCFEIPPSIPARKSLRWAAFMRKCTPKEAAEVLKGLKLDNDTIYRTKLLVQWIGTSVCGEPAADALEPAEALAERFKSELRGQLLAKKAQIRRVMSQMEPELFDDLLTLKMCLSEDASDDRESQWLCQVRDLTEEIRSNRDCISLKTLAVSGHDIMGAGVKPGREVGNTLTRLLDMVLEEPQRNTKEYLLAHLGQSAEK